MLDLLESKEEFQKIEAPQFNEDDRELPNYWILLKFYAAFRLKAQQTNCKHGSACKFGRKCWFKHPNRLSPRPNTHSHCSTITDHSLTAEVHQPYCLDTNILTKQQDKVDSGLSVRAHATAHTTTHPEVPTCTTSRPVTPPQHLQAQTQPSHTSAATESTADQSQASPRTKVKQPQFPQDRGKPNYPDTADGVWQTVAKRPRTHTHQDPQPQQEDQRCKDCQAPFQTSHDKIEWFLNRGLNLPLRCDSCIQQRKEKPGSQSTSTPQIIRQADNLLIHCTNPWTVTKNTAPPQQNEFPPLPKPSASPQANGRAKLCQANHDSTSTSEKEDPINQHDESSPESTSNQETDTEESDTESNASESRTVSVKTTAIHHYGSYSEPLTGRFWDTSTTASSEEQSSQSAPASYWSPQEKHHYDSPREQERTFAANSDTTTDCLPELQDSSSSDGDNEPYLPDPEQFVMNDQRLKKRIKQLLHERPTYQALMRRAWSNTLNQCKVSSQTGSRYKAHVAIYLINQFEHLRRTNPELLQGPEKDCDELH